MATAMVDSVPLEKNHFVNPKFSLRIERVERPTDGKDHIKDWMTVSAFLPTVDRTLNHDKELTNCTCIHFGKSTINKLATFKLIGEYPLVHYAEPRITNSLPPLVSTSIGFKLWRYCNDTDSKGAGIESFGHGYLDLFDVYRQVLTKLGSKTANNPKETTSIRCKTEGVKVAMQGTDGTFKANIVFEVVVDFDRVVPETLLPIHTFVRLVSKQNNHAAAVISDVVSKCNSLRRHKKANVVEPNGDTKHCSKWYKVCSATDAHLSLVDSKRTRLPRFVCFLNNDRIEIEGHHEEKKHDDEKVTPAAATIEHLFEICKRLCNIFDADAIKAHPDMASVDLDVSRENLPKLSNGQLIGILTYMLSVVQASLSYACDNCCNVPVDKAECILQCPSLPLATYDCEDGVKLALHMWNAIETVDTEHTQLQQLQMFMKHYVPCPAIGELDIGPSQRHMVWHCYLMVLNKAYFADLLGISVDKMWPDNEHNGIRALWKKRKAYNAVYRNFLVETTNLVNGDASDKAVASYPAKAIMDADSLAIGSIQIPWELARESYGDCVCIHIPLHLMKRAKAIFAWPHPDRSGSGIGVSVDSILKGVVPRMTTPIVPSDDVLQVLELLSKLLPAPRPLPTIQEWKQSFPKNMDKRVLPPLLEQDRYVFLVRPCDVSYDIVQKFLPIVFDSKKKYETWLRMYLCHKLKRHNAETVLNTCRLPNDCETALHPFVTDAAAAYVESIRILWLIGGLCVFAVTLRKHK